MYIASQNDILNFLFPRYCWLCGSRISKGEKHICSNCLLNLPRTNFHVRKDNPMEQLFWGCSNIVHATAFFYYHQDTPTSEILYLLKYGNCQGIGEYIASVFAHEILFEEANGHCQFFKDIDFIIPLPLNPKKKKIRGYNQCDAICRGLESVTHIPVLYDVAYRTVANTTQTKKSRVERGLNVEQIFKLTDEKEKRALISGKHVLLVDDVCTTGSTLKSFASVFNEIPEIKISIITLGLASPIF